MELNPTEMQHHDIYKMLTGSIVPRPIAWVSTVNPAGGYNLAPYSFFTAVCPSPPLVVFCPTIRNTDGNEKDTLRYIRENGEYVINIVTEATAEAMNITSQETPSDIDETILAALKTLPSSVVKAPRIAASPIHFECKLREIIKLGDTVGSGSMVLGEIVRFHVTDEVYLGNYKINHDALQAVGRLAGMEYSTTRERFQLQRPPSQIIPSDDNSSA